MALVRHASSGRQGYAVWTADGRSSWENEVGPQLWAGNLSASQRRVKPSPIGSCGSRVKVAVPVGKALPSTSV